MLDGRGPWTGFLVVFDPTTLAQIGHSAHVGTWSCKTDPSNPRLVSVRTVEGGG